MKQNELDGVLSQTLADGKLSRGEKQALREILSDLKAGAEQSAFVRNRAFEAARESIHDPRDRRVLDWIEDVIGLLASVDSSQRGRPGASAYFSDEHDCPGKIASLIMQAGESIDVCIYTITDDRISSQILSAHSRGVAVRIITDDEKIDVPGSDIAAFLCAGIPVRTDRSSAYMHNKFAIFDNRIIVTGSYNWTAGAARKNQENFIVAQDPNLVRAFSKYFERLWQQFA